VAGTSTAEVKQMQIDAKEEEIIRVHVRRRLRELRRHIDQGKCAADEEPTTSGSEVKKKAKNKAPRDA
jgi:hypothetical protein